MSNENKELVICEPKDYNEREVMKNGVLPFK